MSFWMTWYSLVVWCPVWTLACRSSNMLSSWLSQADSRNLPTSIFILPRGLFLYSSENGGANKAASSRRLTNYLHFHFFCLDTRDCIAIQMQKHFWSYIQISQLICSAAFMRFSWSTKTFHPVTMWRCVCITTLWFVSKPPLYHYSYCGRVAPMRPKAREMTQHRGQTLAGSRRVTQLGEICAVMDGPCRFPRRTVPFALMWSCSAASFRQIQLLLLMF